MNAHAGLWQRVTRQADEGRLPHALLLAGPRGSGKREFALKLAAYLLCEAPTGAAKPCGACRGCLQRLAGSHPNLMMLAPAEDKRDISIEDIRALLERLTLSAHYGGRKLAIIAPADALNPSGTNALLKTIEEPPDRTHVMLVSERWRALPPTLRSRCQILRFAVARAQRVEDPQAQADAQERAQQWARALTEMAQGKFAPLSLASGLKRDEAQAALETLLRVANAWLQSLLVPGKSRALPPHATPERVQRLMTDALEGLRALERNASPALLLESIMIRWSN